MKKTFITSMPDHAGAFLAASRAIAEVGANITRVSYNKAVDTHTLFIDASGTERQLEEVTERLKAIGYIPNLTEDAQVMLLDFILKDVPGAVLPVLELIGRYNFNISYINSQENGTGFQSFRMGLFVEKPRDIRAFLDEAAQLCEVHIVEYDKSEQVLDNTVFYISFTNTVARKVKLKRGQLPALMAASNQIMQRLDKLNQPPHQTFDVIGKFVDMMVTYSGEKFRPRITRTALKDGFTLHLIEPPCGSNTYILEKDDRLLFIDTGFACYAREMYDIFLALFPDFERRTRSCVITHPDMDHCGLLNLFDAVYVSPLSFEHFRRENAGEPHFREEVPAHAPYCAMTRLVSHYLPPRMECLKVIGRDAPDDPDVPVYPLGSLDFCGLKLDIYRGNGGHAVGEVVIVDEADKLVFSGDILVNPKGFTKPQAEYNLLSPYMMSSVNVNSALASAERRYLLNLFKPGEYAYACGHGAILMPGENAR